MNARVRTTRERRRRVRARLRERGRRSRPRGGAGGGGAGAAVPRGRPARLGERRHLILTPEGVPLDFTIARAGDRVAAFGFDVLLQVMAVLALLLPVLLGAGSGAGVVQAFVMLMFFAVRNGYFVWFEHRWRGQTPGKRLLRIAVIDAEGGALRSEAIFARNLTREVEAFLPAMVLLDPGLLVSTGSGVLRLAAVTWVLLFLLLPLFNAERRRIGDLVGGTVVVNAPRTQLLQDLGRRTRSATGRTPSQLFTPAQLAVYGVYELQVLEALLRETDPAPRTLKVVAGKIRSKIRWGRGRQSWQARERLDDLAFLTAFYQAQRARLERDMLLGVARASKTDHSKTAASSEASMPSRDMRRS